MPNFHLHVFFITRGDKVLDHCYSIHFLEKCPLNCLAIMTMEEKEGGLRAEEHHPNHEAWGWQHHVVWVLCCRRTSQNRWHHEAGKYVDILKQHLKTSVRKLKLCHKWVFQMDNDPKHNSKVVTKWLKDNKVLTSIL
ncbi:unnamed protein product [Oncorhynchus mykiss]|uniref:Tc1-like transposase DDE domain-containing protein n=1 Tax=Oncorhynchus mykiss TaxID=8022 RepID=A0A060Z271_ONCMY|nr:unnamed protein product [Oncorhynchus mykiss]